MHNGGWWERMDFLYIWGGCKEIIEQRLKVASLLRTAFFQLIDTTTLITSCRSDYPYCYRLRRQLYGKNIEVVALSREWISRLWFCCASLQCSERSGTLRLLFEWLWISESRSLVPDLSGTLRADLQQILLGQEIHFNSLIMSNLLHLSWTSSLSTPKMLVMV